MSTLNHYNKLLAEFYSWMFGDFNSRVNNYLTFFRENNIFPKLSKIGIDLGSGSGFQSIALAKQGFEVKAIDFCKQLLDELNDKKENLNILTIKTNLMNFVRVVPKKVELIVCMGDTLTHLESLDDIEILIKDAWEKLENSGYLILEFRDLSHHLKETDRFIPIKSDNNAIFTCFLEYEPNYVKVHDLIYVKKSNNWEFKKSFYRKTIISPVWIKSCLERNNFNLQSFTKKGGLISVIAVK